MSQQVHRQRNLFDGEVKSVLLEQIPVRQLNDHCKKGVSEACYSSFDDEDDLRDVELTHQRTIHYPGALPKDLSAPSCCTQWQVVIFGQILSAALTVASATSLQLYKSSKIAAPSFLLMCMYFFLGTIHFPYWFYSKRKERRKAVTAAFISDLTIMDCNSDEEYAAPSDKRQLTPSFALQQLPDTRPNTFVIDTVDVAADDQQMEVERHLPPARYTFPCYSSFLTLHSCSWKQYCALAFLHVEGNYCFLKSFQFDSFKTVVLLQCISIPAAMVTSAVFLRRKYRCLHILGALLCIIGSAITFRDALDDNSILYPDPVVGDVLAIIGAVSSGVSDVFAEHVVQHRGSIVEYLAMIGFFGTIISFFQVLVFEHSDVASLLFQNNESGNDSSLAMRMFLLSIFTTFGYIFIMLVCADFFYYLRRHIPMMTNKCTTFLRNIM